MNVQVNVSEEYRQDFLAILQSLQNAGMVTKFWEQADVLQEEEEEYGLSEEYLDELGLRLDNVKQGHFFTNEEAKMLVSTWRKVRSK